MKRIITILFCLIFALTLLTSCAQPQQPPTAAELLNLGEKYLLELDYEQALVQFLAVIEIEPMNPRGYTGAAQAYVGLGRVEEAQAVLEQGLERLPGESSLITMLEKLAETPALSENSSVESSEPLDEPLWDSFTYEQRTMLEKLDQAAEELDYKTAYEIMLSDSFGELYHWIDDSSVEYGSHFYYNVNYKEDENWQWGLHGGCWDYVDDYYASKTYYWYRKDPRKILIECELSLALSKPLGFNIRHMGLIDGIANGAFEIIRYDPEYYSVERYEGTAVNNLHSGIETLTTGGDRYVYRYDENGMLTNYFVKNSGTPMETTWMKSEEGSGMHGVWVPDYAVPASVIQ